MTAPMLKIQDEVVIVRPEGLPLSSEIATLAQTAAQAAAVERIAQVAQFGGAGNLFDATAAIVGREVQFYGGVYLEDNSVVSAPMYVGDLGAVTFSGLAPNPAIDRVYVFYNAPPTALNAADPARIAYGQIPAGTSYTVPVPAGAKWMVFSPRQRQPGAGSFAQAQVEAGLVATPFRAYRETLVSYEGRSLRDPNSAAPVLGTLAVFGDSITQTTDVDNGQYVHGSGFRANWLDYAFPMLGARTAYNFAKAEASFANRANTTPFQRFEQQITTAIAQNISLDALVVALGINDLRFVATLGDYDTAMGKAIGALDLTVSLEAARAGFYRLQQAWPDAVKFVSLPLQNVDRPLPAIQAWGELIARMARRYGFTVIDSFSESGIVADFEVNSKKGQDLVDGLHPLLSGMRKLGRLIAARIRARIGA